MSLPAAFNTGANGRAWQQQRLEDTLVQLHTRLLENFIASLRACKTADGAQHLGVLAFFVYNVLRVELAAAAPCGRNVAEALQYVAGRRWCAKNLADAAETVKQWSSSSSSSSTAAGGPAPPVDELLHIWGLEVPRMAQALSAGSIWPGEYLEAPLAEEFRVVARFCAPVPLQLSIQPPHRTPRAPCLSALSRLSLAPG